LEKHKTTIVFLKIMGNKRKVGHIEKFLKRADKAIDEGIKKADEILDDAVEFGEMAATQAKKTSTELRKKAEKEGEILKKKGKEKINESIMAAKAAATSAEDDLKTLEKLGKLKKSGIITEKEFQEKKKKILARI
jgi:polyhydroxyalkanoate synthesis regulator phasin